jgi:TPR repeat protein
MRRIVFSVLIGLGFAGLASAQSEAETGCAAGDRHACYNAGLAYLEGTGVAASANTSIPFFLRACDRGMPDGCTTAGLLILDGAGDLEVNPEAGMHILETGCKRGDDRGCEAIVGYLTADNHPMADRSRVVDVLIEGCKTGSMWACGWGARAALDGYAGKYPEMTNISKAAEIGEIGCDKGNLSACVVSETIFGDPSSELFDAAKSLEFSEINCDSDIAESCNNLARVYYSIEELELGTVAYERACALGMQETCADAKRMRTYLTEKAAYDAAEAERSAAISSLINAGRYGDAVNMAIYEFGSANSLETAVRAAYGASAMSSLNTQDLYVIASWFSSGEVRRIADAEMSARGTGLEGQFGTGTNTAGAADARWKALYGSSMPTSRASSPSSPPSPTLGAGDAAAQVRDKYRTAHCEMAGSNTSSPVCRN